MGPPQDQLSAQKRCWRRFRFHVSSSIIGSRNPTKTWMSRKCWDQRWSDQWDITYLEMGYIGVITHLLTLSYLKVGEITHWSKPLILTNPTGHPSWIFNSPAPCCVVAIHLWAREVRGVFSAVCEVTRQRFTRFLHSGTTPQGRVKGRRDVTLKITQNDLEHGIWAIY